MQYNCCRAVSARLASASWDNSICLWDVAEGALLARIPAHTDRVWSVDWSPAGDFLVTAGRERVLRGWDLWALEASGEAIRGALEAKHQLEIQGVTVTRSVP